MAKLFHVVAMAENRVIGKDNRLPWHFSADLKFFKQLTTGSTVLMGRKTFESIGKPLPGRENFVLSRTPELSQRFSAPNLHFFVSLEEALVKVTTPACYIIGGGKIFEQTLPQVEGIYLTEIAQTYEGDTFYPPVPNYFKEESRTKLQDHPKIEVVFYRNNICHSREGGNPVIF